jgi:hypothetical protein
MLCVIVIIIIIIIIIIGGGGGMLLLWNVTARAGREWHMLTSFHFFQAVNNLAVALLGQGKLKEGIEVLEAALETSPSTLAMAEPFLFNLCACFFSTSFTYGPDYCHVHSYALRASIIDCGR